MWSGLEGRKSGDYYPEGEGTGGGLWVQNFRYITPEKKKKPNKICELIKL